MREVASIGAHRGGVTDLHWYKGGAAGSETDIDMKGSRTVNSHGKEDADPDANTDSDDTSISPTWAGTFLVSGGFDRNVNVFSADDWALCKSLSGHSGNVLSVDVTDDARWIASSGNDRTVKLWAREDVLGT